MGYGLMAMCVLQVFAGILALLIVLRPG